MDGYDVGRLIAFVVSASLLSLIFVSIIQRLAWKHQWFDRPDHRKIHKYPTPRIGGTGIFCSFVIVSILLLFRNFNILPDVSRFVVFLLGSSLIFLLGLIDDFRGMNAYKKFAAQTVAGLIAYWAGFQITRLDLLLWGSVDIGLWGLPLTLLWIAGVTNAVNLIDGINGLAGGVSAIGAFFVGLVAIQSGHYETAFLSFILMGAILGFLPFNLRSAKIFMGDSGSLVIGYILSLLSISAAEHAVSGVSLLVPIAILGLPIIDTLMAIIRRSARGRSLFSSDLGHIHHRLLSRLVCPTKTVLVLYAISVTLGLIALLISYEVRYLSGIAALIVVFGVAVSIGHCGNEELREAFYGRFDSGNRRRTPWYKNKIVYKVTQRMYRADSVKRIYRLLALAGRELEADIVSLNVVLNNGNGEAPVVRFQWPLKDSDCGDASLWVTHYKLDLEDFFSGSLVYGKAEWKRRRRSEEDEIWVMELGKAVHDWLVYAVHDGKIDLGKLESGVEKEEAVIV